MAVRLEHANLTVRDIEGMIRFLKTAFPEFQVRGEGISRVGQAPRASQTYFRDATASITMMACPTIGGRVFTGRFVPHAVIESQQCQARGCLTYSPAVSPTGVLQ